MFGAPFYLGHLGRVPVYISPDSMLMVLLVWMWTQGAGLVGFLISLSTLVVTILLHELGHAAMARAQGMAGVTITIGAMGGYCTYGGQRSAGREVLISLSGVAVNFTVAAICWPIMQAMESALAAGPGGQQMSLTAITYLLVRSLFWWNLVLGIFNSLPIYPLDGGQATLSLSQMALRNPIKARRLTLSLSVGTAVVALALASHFGFLGPLTVIIVIFLVYQAFRDLR